jgi:hypothetical protein
MSSTLGLGLGATSSGEWSAVPLPTVASLNYSQGDTAGGGQSIIITGTNLDSAQSVSFGASSAAITSNTSTTITCTLPAHAAGNVTVTVMTSGGSTTTSFTYWAPDQITGIDVYLDANKGVSTTSSNVNTWTDQSSNGVVFTGGASAGMTKPTQVSNVFGSLPSIRFASGTPENVEAAAKRTMASGFSAFAVAKTSTTFSARSAAPNAAGTIVGEYGSGAWFAFGIDAGASAGARFNEWDSPGNIEHGFTAGSGLNDGAVRLIGVTTDTTPNRKIYVGATQQGSTDSPAGGYSATNSSYQDIGCGRTGVDGFAGDLGAVIIVSGVISAGDLSKLNAWAQQRFGTP